MVECQLALTRTGSTATTGPSVHSWTAGGLARSKLNPHSTRRGGWNPASVIGLGMSILCAVPSLLRWQVTAFVRSSSPLGSKHEDALHGCGVCSVRVVLIILHK